MAWVYRTRRPPAYGPTATTAPPLALPRAPPTAPPAFPWLDSAGCGKPDHGVASLTEEPHLEALMPDEFMFQPACDEDWGLNIEYVQPSRSWSTFSDASASSTGSSLSPVQTEVSETATVRNPSREPSPHKQRPVSFRVPPWTDKGTAENTFKCDWAGCGQQARGFATHDDLVWHVKAEHLLVCPVLGCMEGVFGSAKMVRAHVAVAHPGVGGDEVTEWQLPKRHADEEHVDRAGKMDTTLDARSIATKKRKFRDQLQSAIEKKVKKTGKNSDSQESCAPNPVTKPSFPLVWEHSILPFLIEFIPKWSSPRHIISTTRGRTPDHRRISLTTETEISRSRRIIIAKHVRDLLPENFRDTVSFVFSVGKVARARTWARGPSKDHPDEICAPRNPYCFRSPRMGDSIGIRGNDFFEDSTATLGPCLSVDGGSYWLGNFHPFLEAYKSPQAVQVEHPSPQDRSRCINESHDAMAQDENFKVGDLMVTSGLNLMTTRISHDPYWEDCGLEPPLVVTDWALISASTSRANILRRFPSDDLPPVKESLIRSTSAVVPGATVISSGRTSGYQRGQVCEIPAYVSGVENGTQKATREWFIEEPYSYDNEEAWIRGGIGVEGDSGAAVIDADTNCLIGQVWGRNQYWGPGPRHTFFTPIADVLDDIQEKCGQETRPRLPQRRDEADRFPEYPLCRQCYDLRTYLDSRRSSRMSLQSMIMSRGDSDLDVNSIEAVSELATPRDHYPRGTGIEETGASFNNVFSPGGPSFGIGTPVIADIKSPYAQTLELDDVQEAAPTPGGMRKRSVPSPIIGAKLSPSRAKKHRVAE